MNSFVMLVRIEFVIMILKGTSQRIVVVVVVVERDLGIVVVVGRLLEHCLIALVFVSHLGRIAAINVDIVDSVPRPLRPC